MDREDSQVIKEIHKLLTSRPLNMPDLVPISSLSPVRNQQATQPLYSQVLEAAPSTTHQPTSNELRSRRSPGFNMTQSAASTNTQLINNSRSERPPAHQPSSNDLQSRRSTGSDPRPLSQSTRSQNNSSRSEPRPSGDFTTVLITDSILRHVMDMDTISALGKGNKLHVVNKRTSAGLRHSDLRDKISRIRPDFVYIHLGVNDVHQRLETSESIVNFIDFRTFLETNLPRVKLFISLPLYTRDSYDNEKIRQLRGELDDLVTISQNRLDGHIKDKPVHVNRNSNFRDDNGELRSEYYANDGVHLSDRGKRVILGNLRHHIHDMKAMILNRPRRSQL